MALQLTDARRRPATISRLFDGVEAAMPVSACVVDYSRAGRDAGEPSHPMGRLSPSITGFAHRPSPVASLPAGDHLDCRGWTGKLSPGGFAADCCDRGCGPSSCLPWRHANGRSAALILHDITQVDPPRCSALVCQHSEPDVTTHLVRVNGCAIRGAGPVLKFTTLAVVGSRDPWLDDGLTRRHGPRPPFDPLCSAFRRNIRYVFARDTFMTAPSCVDGCSRALYHI